MIGTKIRSWMEAHIVRPRKKLHRKEASSKKLSEYEITKESIEPLQAAFDEMNITTLVNGTSVTKKDNTEQVRTQYQRQNNSNNLSSPESAYSTGYSTDGTSPGTSFPTTTIAPEYYINIRTGTRYFHSSSSDMPLRLTLPGAGTVSEAGSVSIQKDSDTGSNPTTGIIESTNNSISTCMVASPALTSPRQRNRIRTNPWVSTNVSACNCSPLHAPVARQSILTQAQTSNLGIRPTALAGIASPVRRKWLCSDKKQHCMKCTGSARFEAFSSSSSSSLSVNSVHHAGNGVPTVRPLITNSVISDEEDDRTLNEMMGKYDESYIYEKETDILSDSDPTDCDEDYDDTDVDAGREGGDERDPLTDEDDFDFIDNGSLELCTAEDSKNNFVNMGHCTYHTFIDETRRKQRSGIGDTPTSSRRRKPSDRRMRQMSSKKRRERPGLPILPILLPLKTRALAHMDGSRSAGATPISVRRRRAAALTDQSNFVRSNSIAPGCDPKRRNSISFHHRYVSRSNINTDTKLIELDKEADKKYRELIIEAEHILMSMRTNSPPVIGSPARRPNIGPANKRVELLRNEECGTGNPNSISNSSGNSNSMDMRNPKMKYVNNKINNNTSLPVPLPISKLATPPSAIQRCPLRQDLPRHCPQSEPVKRKVYTHVNSTTDSALPMLVAASSSVNSNAANPLFHRQKLFHTITSLKKNLENQSETLRHTYYGSSQRL